MYKKAQISVLICFFWLLMFQPLLAQKGLYSYPSMDSLSKKDVKPIADALDLFDSDEIFKISIKADFKELIKHKADGEYRDAECSYMLNDTILVRNELKIRARGNYRRNYCALPPVMLNFKKSDYLVAASKDLDKMKMVSVCRQNKTSQQYIFKEYLVYKIYNILTDYSFKTRLIKLSYEDTGEKLKPDTSYAFIIEPVDVLATRNNAIEIESKIMHQDLSNYDHMNFVAVFQFMMGNLDWSVPVQHNIKQLKPLKATTARDVIVVPYDFDFTGFVNTSYALPPPLLIEQAETVRDRLFRGFIRTPEQFEAVFELFRDKKSEIIDLIETFPYLTKSSRTDVLGFIKEFYVIIDSKNLVNKYFIQGCRTQ